MGVQSKLYLATEVSRAFHIRDSVKVLKHGKQRAYKINASKEGFLPVTFKHALPRILYELNTIWESTCKFDPFAEEFVPSAYKDNLSGYRLLSMIINSGAMIPPPKESQQQVNRAHKFAVKHAASLKGLGQQTVSPPKDFFDTPGITLLEISKNLDAWADAIKRMQSESREEFNRIREDRKRNKEDVRRKLRRFKYLHNILPKHTEHQTEEALKAIGLDLTELLEGIDVSGTGTIQMISVGPAYMLMLDGEYCFITPEVLLRVERFLKSWSALAVSISYTNPSLPKGEALLLLLSEIIQAGIRNPEAVGEWLKASRNLLVNSLADDNLMGMSAMNLYLTTLEDAKRDEGLNFYHLLISLFPIKVEAVLVSNCYKSVLHPDADMEKFFEAIEGLKEPHSVEENKLPFFEAMLRRSVALSLMQSGHEIRAYHPDKKRNETNPVVRILSSTKRDMKLLEECALQDWYGLKFNRDKKLTSFRETTVPVSNKASFNTVEVTKEELDRLVKWSHSFGDLKAPPDYLLQTLRNINDVKAHIEGIGDLTSGPAWRRFCIVVQAHEKFESQYPGKTIEDIPSSALANFLLENPHARYLVGTEPKLGEYHKEITRLFYIAEQPLKAVTQRIERIARQMSRCQKGVSIVKSFKKRRGDLETFAALMSNPDEGRSNVFVSFDMTRFSMKFPMALLRVYGTIMAELTGDKELSRMDVIFRGSIVVHNSRGYFGYKAGVKGAFEGFLNFVWSSIHAVVMDCALYEARRDGVLLAYSDDGLLSLVFQEPLKSHELANSVEKTVSKIQKVFLSLGLVFHVSKTMVSAEVWEYLGDICYEGHILDTYWKEMTAYGENETGSGFTPFADTITQISSRARAMCKARAPHGMVYYLMLRESARKVLVRYPGTPDDLLTILFVLPNSSGGLRLPSLTELASSSSVPTLAEVSADLELLSRVRPDIVHLIEVTLFEELPDKMVLARALASGSLLKCNMPDLSGRGLLISLQEAIQDNSVNPTIPNPITESILYDVFDLLKRATNLDIYAVSQFIQSLPPVKEYEESLKIVKSRGALRVLSRQSLAEAQRAYSRTLDQTMDIWMERLSKMEPDGKPLPEVVSRYLKMTYADFNLMPLKRSARVALEKVHSEADIVVNIDLTPLEPEEKFTQLCYAEPRVRMAKQDDAALWASESAPGTEMALWRRTTSLLTGIAFKYPDAVDLFRRITDLFGLELPAIPSVHTYGPDRARRLLGGKPEVAAWAQSAILARSVVRVTGNYKKLLTMRTDSDFTTYPALALLRAASELDFLGCYTDERKLTIHTFRYKLTELDNVTRHEMTSVPYDQLPEPSVARPQIARAPPHAQEEIKATVVDKMQEMRNRDLLTGFQSMIGNPSEEERVIAEAILTRSLVNSLKSIFSNPTLNATGLVSTIGLVNISSPGVLVNSLQLAFCQSLPFKLRRALQKMSYGGDSAAEEVEEDLDPWDMGGEGAVRTMLVKHHEASCETVARFLILCSAAAIPRRSILERYGDFSALLSLIGAQQITQRFTRMMEQKMVIFPETVAGSQMASKEAVHYIRTMAINSLDNFTEIYIAEQREAEEIRLRGIEEANSSEREKLQAEKDRVSQAEWKEEGTRRALDALAAELNFRDKETAIDFVTWLYILKNASRSSSHRTIAHIANSKTVKIRWMQISLIAHMRLKAKCGAMSFKESKYINLTKGGEGLRSLIEGQVCIFPKRVVMSPVMVKAFQTCFQKDLGPDHTKMLVDELPYWVIRRGVDLAADLASIKRGGSEEAILELGTSRVYNCRQHVMQIALTATSFYSMFLQAVQERLIEIPRANVRGISTADPFTVATFRGEVGPLPEFELVTPSNQALLSQSVAKVAVAGSWAVNPESFDLESVNSCEVRDELMKIQLRYSGSTRLTINAPSDDGVCLFVQKYSCERDFMRAVIYYSRSARSNTRFFPLNAKFPGQWIIFVRSEGKPSLRPPTSVVWGNEELEAVVDICSWKSYESLLSDLDDSISARFTVTPSPASSLSPGELVMSTAALPAGYASGMRSRAESGPMLIALARSFAVTRSDSGSVAMLAAIYSAIELGVETDSGKALKALQKYYAKIQRMLEEPNAVKNRVFNMRDHDRLLAIEHDPEYVNAKLLADQRAGEIRRVLSWLEVNPIGARPADANFIVFLTNRLQGKGVRTSEDIRSLEAPGFPLPPAIVLRNLQRFCNSKADPMLVSMKDAFFQRVSVEGGFHIEASRPLDNSNPFDDLEVDDNGSLKGFPVNVI